MRITYLSPFFMAVATSGVCATAGAAVLPGWPVVLREVPGGPLARDRHTTLLAHFDSPSTSDADYARTHPQEVGFQSDPSAPGKFGGGVAVTGANGYVMFAGLDNIGRWRGTVEFWAKSRPGTPIWNDGKTHWLFVAFPERAGFLPKEGMAPYPLGLFKSAGNELVFNVAQKSTARYALGVELGGDAGWQLRVPAGNLKAEAWHHVLISYDLRPPGRVWLVVDGQGVTTPLGLPPTYGWADQYDQNNKPVWMRNFEPPAVSMQAVGAVIPALAMMYDMTGEERYLAPLRKCLTWLDKVPENDRGWLWYDPQLQRPVVAYYNEVLPVDHPKAIKEIIPRLADHYGVKSPWPADRIRQALNERKSGPIYPSFSGWKPRSTFAADRPTAERLGEAFRRSVRGDLLHRLKEWLAGRPVQGLVVESRDYGRQFNPMEAARLAARLMDDVEAAHVALGDLPVEKQPRFHPGVWGAWVYAFPDIDLYHLPRPSGTKR